ncbi:MAG: PD-(D/E)XK nuclease family protein, partial [Planctomycetota bacterium]|nr:PD-(D/E)XK nuclease family protein [Planctomycetota bacterium]
PRRLAPALQTTLQTPAPGRLARARRRASDPLGYTADELALARSLFAASVESTSVSSLNHGVLCPHRFFLAKVARVPQDDFRLDGPVFDTRDRGTALHHAFELALKHRDWSPEKLAAAGVAKVGAQGIEASLLREELERSVVLLRERERDTAGELKPWSQGLEFNFRDDKAVEIGPEDCRFRLGGEVDRLDRTAEEGGLASILDYKRSESSSDSYFKRARDGHDLQLPLYARAMEELLGVSVVGFEWVAGLTRSRRVIHDERATALFEGRRETRPLSTEPTPAFRARIDTAEATAAEVVRRARAGDHARAPVEKGVCADCYWKDVCRPDVTWLEKQIPPPPGEDAAAPAAGGDA